MNWKNFSITRGHARWTLALTKRVSTMVLVGATFVALIGSLACAPSSSSSSSTGESGSKAPPKNSRTGKTAQIELRFVYGSEKKHWLQAAIDAFHRDPASTIDGVPIRVQGQAMGSGSSLTDIVSGAIQPHLWSPASEVYVSLLNRAWSDQQGTLGDAVAIADDARPLVLSPVVIAMWRPMAEALGWPTTSIGWADILSLSTNPQGWASRGRPEWGLFKLGHTHPEFSNSGLLSVLAEIYAATGKTKDLSRADLAQGKVTKFLEDIESSIVHYGKSTGFFADKMLLRGPGYLSAAVVYENLVIDSYRRPEYSDRVMDMVAIYPKEGTFWIDNPLVILQAPWVSDAHKQAGAAFRDFLLSKEMQSRAMSEFGFRPSDPSVAIGAPIDMAHGVDAKQPQTLLSLPTSDLPDLIDAALAAWRKAKKTVDIVFVFDRSGSMTGQPLKEAKQGASDFLSMLDERDRVSILPFNHHVPTPVAEPVAAGAHRDALRASIRNTFADGGTALYDAVALAHAAVKSAAEVNPKRNFAVVVLTDGMDEHSERTYEQLLVQIAPPAERRLAVKLFAIAYGAKADKKILNAIAESGGGALFSGDPDSIRQVYRDLAAFF